MAALLGVPLLAAAATPEDRSAARELRKQQLEAQRAAAEARKQEIDERNRARGAEARQSRQDREQGCEKIVAWLSDSKGMPDAVLARRFGGAAASTATEATLIAYESWLFQDARFAPAFGKRYDEVPRAEWGKLQEAGNGCRAPRNERGQAMSDNMLFFRAFDERYHAQYAKGVARIREALGQIDTAFKDLQSLRADDDGARRFREHAGGASSLASFLADDRRSAYTQALRAGYERSVEPYHVQRMKAAAAQGHDGLSTLVALQSEMTRDARLADASPLPPPEFRARVAEIVRGIVAAERSRIDALGSGLVGLERGVQWHAEHMKRFDARYTQAAPELQGVRSYFAERRQQVLDGAEPELARHIAAARTEPELGQLLSRYIPLDMDRTGRSGAALMARVAEQNAELHKRAVLGTPGSVPATPAAPAPVRTATTPSGGEPSESEMYDAFNGQLQAVNDEARRTAERCNNREFNRGQGDPILAMQCLQFGVGVGVTAGAQGVLAPSFKVSRFQKVACEKAQGEAGYNCDYVAGMAGNLNLPPSLAGIVRNGSVSQARFIRQGGGGWVMLPSKDR